MNEQSGKNNLRYLVRADSGRPLSAMGSGNSKLRDGNRLVSSTISTSFRSQPTVNPANTKARQALKVMDHLIKYLITYSVQCTFFIALVIYLIGSTFA